MGITKLADLIRSVAPSAISHRDISDYTGKQLIFIEKHCVGIKIGLSSSGQNCNNDSIVASLAAG